MLVTAPNDVAGAEAAADRVVEIHRRLVDFLRPGLTLAEVDDFVGRALADLDSRSAFIGYAPRPHPPFPSHACLSVNECVVHGHHGMTKQPLQAGDVFSVDIGVVHDGWIGDAAWTYAIAEQDDVAASLMRAGAESLRLGIEAMQPGRPLIDWAKAVQGHVERDKGFHLVRGLGGHGYGKSLHAPPFVSNVVPSYPGEWPEAFKTFRPGMLIAVEPMLALTTNEIASHGREWPIRSADGSLTVHYEADVLITEDGPRNLTEALFDLPEVVGA